MEQKRKLLLEIGIIAILSLILFFISSNVNTQLGQLYQDLALVAIVIVFIDYFFGRKELNFSNPNSSWIGSVLWALGGYAVLIFIGPIIVKLLSGVPLVNVLSLLEVSAPVFSNSKIINDITFVFIIPILETYCLFIAFYDLLASMFKVSIIRDGLKSWKIWMIIFVLSGFFTILHSTSKELSQSSLIIVFIMGFISLIIITINKSGRESLLMHIIANSLAIFTRG